MKTWLITGCSTGFGRSLARAVAASGNQAVVTARRTDALREFEAMSNVRLAPLDVTDSVQIRRTVADALEQFGRIDVLVNNAGYGFRGAVEEADDGEVNRIFQTNFFGPLHLIQAVLPSMRENRSGLIINFSSIAAFRTAEGSLITERPKRRWRPFQTDCGKRFSHWASG